MVLRDSTNDWATQEPAHHVLNPSARVLWRAPEEIQLELGQRAVVLDGMNQRGVRRLLGAADPPRRAAQAPPIESVDPPGLGPALDELAGAGFLWNPTHDPAPSLPPRLAPDVAAAQLRHGRRGREVLAARARCSVSVLGRGRVAGAVSGLLAAAGIGRVSFTDRGDVLLRTAMPGAASPQDEGQPFTEVMGAALRRIAPEVDTTPLATDARPDLVVLAPDVPVEPGLRERLHRDGRPHLLADAGGDHVIVGPLVLPGLTSCLRCADLHRIDRDPAWSALAVQLSIAPRGPRPSDVVLASLCASLAALQALTFLDGDEPAVLAGTVELRLPDWRLRRRSWPARAECDCGAAGARSQRWAQ
jgi:hypothetical protein